MDKSQELKNDNQKRNNINYLRQEALKMADLIKKNKIDYSQLIFDIQEEQRHEIILPKDNQDISVIDNCVSEETLRTSIIPITY